MPPAIIPGGVCCCDRCERRRRTTGQAYAHTTRTAPRQISTTGMTRALGCATSATGPPPAASETTRTAASEPSATAPDSSRCMATTLFQALPENSRMPSPTVIRPRSSDHVRRPTVAPRRLLTWRGRRRAQHPGGPACVPQGWTHPGERPDDEDADSYPGRAWIVEECTLHLVLGPDPAGVLRTLWVVVHAERAAVRFRRWNPLQLGESTTVERDLRQVDSPWTVGEVHDCLHLLVAAPAAGVIHLGVVGLGQPSYLVEIVRHVVAALGPAGKHGKTSGEDDPDEHGRPGPGTPGAHTRQAAGLVASRFDPRGHSRSGHSGRSTHYRVNSA